MESIEVVWNRLIDSAEGPLTLFLLVMVPVLAYALWRQRADHLADLRASIGALERNTTAVEAYTNAIERLTRAINGRS